MSVDIQPKIFYSQWPTSPGLDVWPPNHIWTSQIVGSVKSVALVDITRRRKSIGSVTDRPSFERTPGKGG